MAGIVVQQFFICTLAEAGEVFLGQFTVSEGDPRMATKALAEETLKDHFHSFDLRFHYGQLEYAGRAVSSEEYGRLTVADGFKATAFGGAVFGKVKVDTSLLKVPSRRKI
jgi:hypothetical protein